MKLYAAPLVALALLAGCGRENQPPPPAPKSALDSPPEVPVMGPERRILAIGDSLFAGYGLADGEAYPERMEAALRARGINARIANAGVSGDTTAGDVMEMTVGDVQVQVGRHAPFTATEHARGAAMADLVSDVLARTPTVLGSGSRRLGGGATPAYEVVGRTVRASVQGVVVGAAAVRPAAPDGEDGDEGA